eukprot:7982181-Prorocentrum_lima.AAC.1
MQTRDRQPNDAMSVAGLRPVVQGVAATDRQGRVNTDSSKSWKQVLRVQEAMGTLDPKSWADHDQRR